MDTKDTVVYTPGPNGGLMVSGWEFILKRNGVAIQGVSGTIGARGGVMCCGHELYVAPTTKTTR
ncbi:MAG: hypothetical protein ACRCX2_32215 [Paraclostridium sp.]